MATLCPKCKEELRDSGVLHFNGIVDAEHDPYGKARVDAILECSMCGHGWNAFVALEDFFHNPCDAVEVA
jgi:hypothetical protein